MELFAELVITVASVLLAGLLATPFALRQLRRERAFERRLEWAERATHRLADAGKAYRDVSAAIQAHEGVVEAVDRATASVEAFRPTYRESLLYATPESAQSLVSAMQGVHEALRAGTVEAAAQASGGFYSAADRLRNEIRAELKLKPLSDTVGTQASLLSRALTRDPPPSTR